MSIPERFKIRVACTTFNHKNFIEATMDGFVMQRTDFPYICAILDDASTDGSAEIIRNYLETSFLPAAETSQTDDYKLTVRRHKTNANCFFAVYFLKYNHYSLKKSKDPYIIRWVDRSDYSALCEGDDWWICPDKLQRQADFLDSHPEYSMCSHVVGVYDQDSGDLKHYPQESDKEYSLVDVASGGHYFQTLSVMYRNGIITQQMKLRYRIWQDVLIVYNLLKAGRGIRFKEEMGVYRVHCGGIWSGVDKQAQDAWDFRLGQAIYDTEQTSIAALRLVYCFSKTLNRIWMIKNPSLIVPALRTIAKHFGAGTACRIYFSKMLLSRNVIMRDFLEAHPTADEHSNQDK